MKALVVYESMWGNTKQVAEANADGLQESMEVELVDVNRAPAEPEPDVGLIVAGGPTHAFSMSRTNTRADAVNPPAGGPPRGPGWAATPPCSSSAHRYPRVDPRERCDHRPARRAVRRRAATESARVPCPVSPRTTIAAAR